MRMVIVTALCAALTGCVTDDQLQETLDLAALEHDAHCRSLMMQPGTLVYVQCRLAMSETLRRAEERDRRLLEGAGAPLPAAVETALREDVFCNFNESTILSVQPGEAAATALAASGRCTESRGRLQQAVREWQPFQSESLLDAYARNGLATNEATITEARTFS